ncbi:unnamed protein product [Sphagnum compactum]
MNVEAVKYYQEQLVVLGGGFMNSEAAAARSGSGMNMSSSSSSMMIGMLSRTGSDRDMDLLQSFDLQQFAQLPSCTSSSEDHRRSSCMKKMVQQQLQSQRMTHIAVERNRRKQMNENLGTLRALMPGSYVPKGDQASIIGSAIEFVKELEQLLQCLQAQKKRRSYTSSQLNNNVMQSSTRSNSVPMIMSPSGIIIKPKGGLLALTLQPGAAAAAASSAAATAAFQDLSSNDMKLLPEAAAAAAAASESDQALVLAAGAAAETNSKSEMANVEVKAVGSNAWIKVLAQRRSPGQLLRTMTTLEESLDLSILHCNITTVDNTVLYSFHVWIGNKCLSTVQEIAAAIQHTLLQNITI